MTVMATATREFSINKLLELAAKTAGIMALEQSALGAQWDARARYGRDQLELIVDALQADGLMVRDVELYTLTLSDGTASYAMPSDTLDVLSDAQYKASSTAQGTLVRQIDREEYLSYPDRTKEATPTRMWVDRGATITIYLLDVPDTDDAQLIVQRQRLLADNSDGGATVDLDRHWLDYLHFELAARFASAASLPSSKIEQLEKKAADKKKVAQTKAKQNVPNVVELFHPTPWS